MKGLTPEQERYWWNAPAWLKDRVEQLEKWNSNLTRDFNAMLVSNSEAENNVRHLTNLLDWRTKELGEYKRSLEECEERTKRLSDHGYEHEQEARKVKAWLKTLPGTPPPPPDDDLKVCERALRDIKSQALVADRTWLLSCADAALRKIRS